MTASRFHQEVTGRAADPPLPLPLLDQQIQNAVSDPVTLAFSELASFRACGFACRLRVGARFPAVPGPRARLRQGRCIMCCGRWPSTRCVTVGRPMPERSAGCWTTGSCCPRRARRAPLLKEAARQLVSLYVCDYDDLRRVWETERPFELHLPGAIISGRADVILERFSMYADGGDPYTSCPLVNHYSDLSHTRVWSPLWRGWPSPRISSRSTCSWRRLSRRP